MIEKNQSSTQIIGYIRVSDESQNTARQLDGIMLDRTFTDKISGAVKKRPALDEMIEYIREGDIVVVHSLDRLGRNLIDLNELIQTLNDKGAIVRFVKEHVEFTPKVNNPLNRLWFHILGAVAEFERERIRERQREGIEKGKANGVYTGKKQKLDDETKAKAVAAASVENANLTQVAKDFGIGRMTLWRYIKDAKKTVEPK